MHILFKFNAGFFDIIIFLYKENFSNRLGKTFVIAFKPGVQFRILTYFLALATCFQGFIYLFFLLLFSTHS